MDKLRTDQSQRRRKRWMIATAIALGLAGVTVVLARLKPAAPSVDRNLVVIETVRRGPMLRQVRGIGTLVPEDISWITARTSGRVTRIVLRPGAIVKPDDVILVLDNPEVRQAAVDADSQLRVAEAELLSTRAQLESSVLAAEAAAANARAENEQSRLKAEVNDRLFKNGLVSDLELQLSKVTAEQAATRNLIEQKRFDFTKHSITPQLAVKQADVERFRAQAGLRHEELDALSVRAGMEGVLQVLPVEVGAQVASGTNLARVADPTKLKAVIRVAETQVKDIQLGQSASIDTRNGVVGGRVVRIDPSVRDGTVTVDVTLTGNLPRGARPDLSVEGTIELERLSSVVFVGRPAFGEEKSKVRMFKLAPQGDEAARTTVELGRSSVNTVEIVSGLVPGDKVILSDMSQWDESDRIRLK
jgi:HlyD family secretion protein